MTTSELFIEINENKNLKIYQSFQLIMDQLGHVLPLNCGHNGMLLVGELQTYELHLGQSGFIKGAWHY